MAGESYTVVEIQPVIEGVKAMSVRYHIAGAKSLQDVADKLEPGFRRTLEKLLPPDEQKLIAAHAEIAVLKAELAAAQTEVEKPKPKPKAKPERSLFKTKKSDK